MLRKALLIACALLLWTGMAGAQDWIRYYPPSGLSTMTGTATTTTSTVPFLFASGTESLPGIAWSAAPTYGWYFSGNAFRMTFAANQRIYFSAGAIGFATPDFVEIGDTAAPLKNIYVNRSILGSKSKALTDATATAFVRIAIPQTIATNYKGGQVIYEIYCDDDTNQASQAGTVKFTCHNLAGTEACGFGTPDGVTLGDGTVSLAAPTFDATSSAADTIDLRVNSDCTGAAPNTHTIEWRLDMPTTATITPQ